MYGQAFEPLSPRPVLHEQMHSLSHVWQCIPFPLWAEQLSRMHRCGCCRRTALLCPADQPITWVAELGVGASTWRHVYTLWMTHSEYTSEWGCQKAPVVERT